MLVISYNFGHRNLSQQTQEILRQQKRSNDQRMQEEKKRKESVKAKIIDYLMTQEEPKPQGVIAEEIEEKEPAVVSALNELSKEKKVEIVVQNDEEHMINAPCYSLIRSNI